MEDAGAALGRRAAGPPSHGRVVLSRVRLGAERGCAVQVDRCAPLLSVWGRRPTDPPSRRRCRGAACAHRACGDLYLATRLVPFGGGAAEESGSSRPESRGLSPSSPTVNPTGKAEKSAGQRPSAPSRLRVTLPPPAVAEACAFLRSSKPQARSPSARGRLCPVPPTPARPERGPRLRRLTPGCRSREAPRSSRSPRRALARRTRPGKAGELSRTPTWPDLASGAESPDPARDVGLAGTRLCRQRPCREPRTEGGPAGGGVGTGWV